MARLNVRGSQMMERLCRELSVPYRRNGSLVAAYSPEERRQVEELYQRGLANGVEGLELLSRQQALEREPNLNPAVELALYAPTGAIVNPWELAVALCDNAVENGAQCLTGEKVTAITLQPGGGFVVETEKGKRLAARFVVNAAGVYADQISRLVGDASFTIRPSKGSYYVLDKGQGSLFSSTVFQCPGKEGKGVLISPTVHGNLIVGPDAQDVEDREDVSCQADRLAFVRKKAEKTCLCVDYRQSIRNFAGLRANSDQPDFIIQESGGGAGIFPGGGDQVPGPVGLSGHRFGAGGAAGEGGAFPGAQGAVPEPAAGGAGFPSWTSGKSRR